MVPVFFPKTNQAILDNETYLNSVPNKRGENTLPETNVANENGWLEYYFPIGEAYFQGLC